MSAILNKDAEFFETHFSKNVELVNKTGFLLHAYDGVLNSETISKLETEIESKIVAKGIPKTVVRKVFFICVESLQNMFIHGFKDENGSKHNFFILYTTDKVVKMIGANLISNAAIPKITKHIERINSFDDSADLRNYYLEHLEHNTISPEGGAGLGFITIAMKSGNKLKTEFMPINEIRSLFYMEVTVNID